MSNQVASNNFINKETASGLVLFAAAIIAIVWANSNWSETYHDIWNTPLQFSLGSFSLQKPILLWINDGLMAIFFFVVGLEIKRELLIGELSSLKQAALPVAAAIGGMVIPALLFVSLNIGQKSLSGWGIPMATDIAFSLGVLALLGRRAHPALRIFLTALAIADDLGAVLVIAIFYTAQLNTLYLAGSLGLIVLLAVASRMGLRQITVYVLIGIISWFLMLKSGVHATIAGVLLAFVIPISTKEDTSGFVNRMQQYLTSFAESGPIEQNLLKNKNRQSSLHAMHMASQDMETPLERMEHALLPFVSFFIMPVFALANAGVTVVGSDLEIEQLLQEPLFLGIVAGLLLGKPIGIGLLSWIALRLRLATLPDGITMIQVLATGLLAGIGFTMSLFIASLAFNNNVEFLETAKLAILVASILAGIGGAMLLYFSSPVESEISQAE